MDFDDLDEAAEARISESIPAAKAFVPKTDHGDLPPLRFGVLSTANIVDAGIFGPTLKSPKVACLAGIASRERELAAKFVADRGEYLKSAKIFDNYQDLLDSADIDCVYIPLPNALHYEWTLKALEAGKHVLCEKPFASNAEEAKAMVELAKKKQLVLLEGQHWIYHPITDRLHDIIKSGVLGTIQELRVQFNLTMGLKRKVLEVKGTMDPKFFGGKMWICKTEMAGGLTMTLGTYCINFARVLLGEEPTVCSAKPECLADNSELDINMKAELSFPNSQAKAFLDWSALGPEAFHNEILIKGSEANLETAGLMTNAGPVRVTVKNPEGKEFLSEEIDSAGFTTYDLQLLAFADHVHAIRAGKSDPTSFPNTGSDPVCNMEVIDHIYSKAGMQPRSGPAGIFSPLAKRT
eukprot:TRINITY_DN91816_c0_g1_i1.p1 TRINITY_DN91816_c0_g1~~TRINITY_DN91816_c0_g1_i1.p1  ORF type:complete len:408 (+),score=84.79 TRINITY_DN91816_c0_g1_i1:40-1263(+)